MNILQSIGNTPLVRLEKVVPEHCADIYIKLEYFNPTGSYKDRMALAIIEEAELRGDLKSGMTVLECTGGSTGTSLSFICSVKNYPIQIISSDAFAKEKLQAIKLFGANLTIVESEGGKITPDLIPKMIGMAKELNESDDYYWTKQFENKDALTGYYKMGEEILQQLNQPIHHFCAAIGTAGMFTGVAQALKNADPNTRCTILEPASAPLLSAGVKGTHTVDGIGVGMVPPLLDQSTYNEVMAINESAARIMAKRLAAEEGIFAGTSTGLNVVAAIEIAQKLGAGHTVVTVACDSGMKYTSGGLFN